MELEKMKEGQLIEEMDLLKQVEKVMNLIRRKMNNTAYE